MLIFDIYTLYIFIVLYFNGMIVFLVFRIKKKLLFQKRKKLYPILQINTKCISLIYMPLNKIIYLKIILKNMWTFFIT